VAADCDAELGLREGRGGGTVVEAGLPSVEAGSASASAVVIPSDDFEGPIVAEVGVAGVFGVFGTAKVSASLPPTAGDAVGVALATFFFGLVGGIMSLNS